MDISQLKAMLSMLGVKNLAIKFDTSHRRIVATFGFHGQACEKVISFAEIERAFSNTDRPSG